MTDLLQWIPLMVPREGAGATMAQIRRRLEGRAGKPIDPNNVRKSVHRATEKGAVRCEVYNEKGVWRYRVWRTA